MTWIARRLHLDTPKSARTRLRNWEPHSAIQLTTQKSIATGAAQRFGNDAFGFGFGTEVLEVARVAFAHFFFYLRQPILRFTKDYEFSSPSGAAAIVHGGGANGLVEWKCSDGKTLKELDALG